MWMENVALAQVNFNHLQTLEGHQYFYQLYYTSSST